MSRKNKKVINKDDLRRLMKQQKSAAGKNEKKIDSPLAKYDSLGQLHCSLCGCKVKNELLWTAHVNGKTHKQNLIIFKERELRKNEATVRPPELQTSNKRKLNETNEEILNKIKKLRNNSSKSSNSNVPSDLFDNNSSQSNSQNVSLGLGDYSSDEESEEDEGQPIPSSDTTQNADSSSGLPTDFFDSGVLPTTAGASKEPEETEPSVQTIADKLPEGFFDDAKKDAKVRKVEYKDKKEEEWEMFQKAMKEEHQVSEAIQEEDEEAVQVERNIDQIDEQIYHWSKVEELHQKKEQVMSNTDKTGQEEDSSNSDIDEQEYEEFLDWRSKNV